MPCITSRQSPKCNICRLSHFIGYRVGLRLNVCLFHTFRTHGRLISTSTIPLRLMIFASSDVSFRVRQNSRANAGASSLSGIW
jgi:hypothetical protein